MPHFLPNQACASGKLPSSSPRGYKLMPLITTLIISLNRFTEGHILHPYTTEALVKYLTGLS